MLVTIQEFRDRIQGDCDGLVRELQALTGRTGEEEAKAWRSSLPKLSLAFSHESFQPLHLYFGSKGYLSLEYQLPASSSWCDVVLLGAKDSNPSAVIIELKDWMIRGDKPGRYQGLVDHMGKEVLHPSDQVRGYVEYCRHFHSTVSHFGASVHGCVLFTRDQWTQPYFSSPNEGLVKDFPVFGIGEADLTQRFPEFFNARLREQHAQFARAFEEGTYRQSRGFMGQIGNQILDPRNKTFELLDGQRKAFALCKGIVGDLVGGQGKDPLRKRVVIVNGPPGSGKSAIAAQLWASLVTDKNLPEGNVVFTTTSLSQFSNWRRLFDAAAGLDGATGIVRKASIYTPLSAPKVGRLMREKGDGFLSDATQWRSHLMQLQAMGIQWRKGARDNENLVTIIDEAHSLINTVRPGGLGMFGFASALGPQAYHIIRASVISVFLLDPDQGFRRRENTTLDDLRAWSRELGAGDPEEIDLGNAQFRCAGSPEYVLWLESLLSGTSAETNKQLATLWRAKIDTRSKAVQSGVSSPQKAAEPDVKYSAHAGTGGQSGFDFRVFEDPESLEKSLAALHAGGASVRLLSSYSREWKTRTAAHPHRLPPGDMDFHESYTQGGKRKYWSRIWNYVSNDDFSWFVTSNPAGHIAKDPLCEVGCPYVVRGFDYDYVGVLWLNDLLWRDGEWVVDPTAIKEAGFSSLTNAARLEVERNLRGPAYTELRTRVVQAYRILFTRALKGAYVWVPDPETRQHLLGSLSPTIPVNS
jgi:uncharacterized protein